MEPIQVEFTFTAEIFWKTQQYILWHTFKKGWLKWIFLVLVVVWTLNQLMFHGAVNFLISLSMMALFAGLWWLIFYWLSKRNFSKFSALKHPIRYVFSETDISLNTQNSQSVLQWAIFQNVTETEVFFLLHQNRVAANPILKSGFHSVADLERFRALLYAKGLLLPSSTSK